ncbi:Gfo/Idh/MocA family protein [Brevibacillus dissolubilis]|uniref:Gfo/Idh/MocA family protein n=1 Tax=Brevibacillus dissolubilis TaxID=1844116 RepID=UPI001116D04C|nr:Gfo/Idh/MocA family oxidoreductase [Brevibacillus dissolubilis]
MKSNQPIGVGIIGLGAIGRRVLEAFKQHPMTQVRAVCDVSPELAHETATTIDGCNDYTGYHALLADGGVELVYIAVPPAYHREIALAAFSRQKHVFCEKPLANSIEEAHDMLTAAQSAGVVHAINFPLPYQGQLDEFTRLVEAGFLGELRRVEMIMHFPQWPRHWQQNNWVGGREQGGYIREVAPHLVQAILQLFGPITKVHSDVEYPAEPTRCETSVIATMRLESGVPVLVNGLSDMAAMEKVAVTAYGTSGTISLENWSILKTAPAGQPLTACEVTSRPAALTLIDQLVTALHGQQPAKLVDFHMGYDIQRIIEALRGGSTSRTSNQP